MTPTVSITVDGHAAETIGIAVARLGMARRTLAAAVPFGIEAAWLDRRAPLYLVAHIDQILSRRHRGPGNGNPLLSALGIEGAQPQGRATRRN